MTPDPLRAALPGATSTDLCGPTTARTHVRSRIARRARPIAARALGLALAALACLWVALPRAEAQLGDRLARAAQRGAERALERKAEEKAAEAVEAVFEQPAPEERAHDGADAREVGATTGEADDEAASGAGDGAGAPATAGPAATPFRLDSKFDFEPGTEVIYFDDFERVSVGDFPTGYNTNGAAEVVTVSTAPGKWLRVSEQTEGLHLMNAQGLPGDFTLEFDLIHDLPAEGYRYNANLGIVFTDLASAEAELNEHMRVGGKTTSFWIERDITRGWFSLMRKWTQGSDLIDGAKTRLDEHFSDATRGRPQHIALWRQGRRMRLYVNQQKVYDVPLAWPDAEPIASLRLFAALSDEADNYLVSNLRIARGAPDTRSRLVTEGRLTTYGITFASGSSELQPASAGTLKAIAGVLAENPSMRLRITGHTDADGSEEANQTLSERRAAAVKAALATHYAIDGARLETAGRGEAEPVAPGDTPEAKAQNRRVVLEVLK